MIRYKGFGFFIIDDTIYIRDSKNNIVLVVKDIKNTDNQIELGRSLIEQYISDCKKENKND